MQKQKQQGGQADEAEDDAADGGGFKEPQKFVISGTAATTAAEIGAQLADQVMGAVEKVLTQCEGAGNKAMAACGTKAAACEDILKSMQEKVTELQQLKQVMENKSSWMPSWVSGPALRTAFGRC